MSDKEKKSKDPLEDPPKIVEEKEDSVNNIAKETEREDTAIEDKDLKFQTPEDPGKPVIIAAEAYKTIILYASRYANQMIPSHEWKEIYGILIGRIDDDFVYVDKAEALTYGHSTDVTLDERHYGFIAAIEDKLYEENTGQFIVGWFHSHPGLNLFFSYIDLVNQIGFQGKNLDAVGLVFDHTLLGKKKQDIIKGEDGIEHAITKFDTGFEIYRITDVIMDINDPKFDTNYHKVDYIVDGLNKFFFANVLSELSALASAGKPLQTAYGEQPLESSYKDPEEKLKNMEPELDKGSSKELLVEIPADEDMAFDVDDFFYDVQSKEKQKSSSLREAAEQLIFEGNQALQNKDAFTGIEKYRQGIAKFTELNDHHRVLELLKDISEHCISTNHQKFAEEFAENLYNLASEKDHTFYKAEGNYLMGYLLLKKASNDSLEYQLKMIQEASIDYEKAGDYAGAGRAYYKIGTIYHSRLNQQFQACLFYTQAIKSYNEAILRHHHLRKSLWAKAEVLTQKITEIRDTTEELMASIQDLEERSKIESELRTIKYHF